jgi:hypothetical protein
MIIPVEITIQIIDAFGKSTPVENLIFGLKMFSDGGSWYNYSIFKTNLNGRIHLTRQQIIDNIIDPLANNSENWSPFSYAFNNPIKFSDPDGMEGENPDVSEDANSITYKGNTAQEVFKILKEHYDHGNDDQNDPEAEAKGLIKQGQYDAAVDVIYINNPGLTGYLSHDLFRYEDNQTGTPRIFETTGPFRWQDNDRVQVLITVYTRNLDRFANDDPHVSYAIVVNALFHEFVHAKQNCKVEGMHSLSSPENELEAYYQEAFHRNDLPALSDDEKNLEYGHSSIEFYILNRKEYSATVKRAMLSAHRDQVSYLLNQVTDQQSTLLKNEIYDQTGLKF